MHQLADFLSKRGTRSYYSRHELQARARRGKFDKVCIIKAAQKVLRLSGQLCYWSSLLKSNFQNKFVCIPQFGVKSFLEDGFKTITY